MNEFTHNNSKFTLETKMEKPSSNGDQYISKIFGYNAFLALFLFSSPWGSVYFNNIWLQWFLGSLSILLSLAKRPIENESEG